MPMFPHPNPLKGAWRGSRRGYTAFLALLEQQVFPAVVTYATHPLVILLTILLLAPLILDSQNTALALTLGNYTNVVSAAVSSIVLATSLKLHVENKRLHAQHHDDLQALHAKVDALTPPVAPPPKPVTRRKVAPKKANE